MPGTTMAEAQKNIPFIDSHLVLKMIDWGLYRIQEVSYISRIDSHLILNMMPSQQYIHSLIW